LAKNVFGAGKVITTVSTSKVAKVPELLGEGVVDQGSHETASSWCLRINWHLIVIDYTKGDPREAIPPQSVDFMLDTTGQAMQFLSLMKPSTGLIISISTTPSGTQLQESGTFTRPDKPRLPWWIRLLLNTTDGVRKLRAQRWKVQYQYMFLDSNAKDLEVLRQHVEDGKVAPVVGSTCDLRDIKKVKEACHLVFAGKGGIGKAVFEVVLNWSCIGLGRDGISEAVILNCVREGGIDKAVFKVVPNWSCIKASLSIDLTL
jgi:NADPH:quinone reductase-like Zn-dependent oxidoreductase